MQQDFIQRMKIPAEILEKVSSWKVRQVCNSGGEMLQTSKMHHFLPPKTIGDAANWILDSKFFHSNSGDGMIMFENFTIMQFQNGIFVKLDEDEEE